GAENVLFTARLRGGIAVAAVDAVLTRARRCRDRSMRWRRDGHQVVRHQRHRHILIDRGGCDGACRISTDAAVARPAAEAPGESACDISAERGRRESIQWNGALVLCT